ncbi:hypothetical protein B0J11DRAFT_540410 [Dendryphion nanum]|uniref:Uncharacterized protein n=1 Tax=Dendryphion nanum TaxID=256645 RepID=A0A9P9IC10_9PLEO|nr:hypothetical protein B0J11DRAFT_540410 [Dendryphion nanum]
MDPFANRALYSAKAHLLSQDLQKRLSQMPPPPAYHLVVDPNNAHTGIPIQTPFGAVRSEEEAEETGIEEEEEDDVPEVTINATTQVRGHGNIISVPQMDSVRIAGMVYCMLNGMPLAPMSPTQATSSTTSDGQTQPTAQTPPNTSTNSSTQSTSSTSTNTNGRRPLKAFPKINITVNCGATVIGDRNVVGPGLGDIARNIQVANQRAQMHQMQARATQAAQSMVPGIQIPATTPTQMPTPPMSRSASGNGDCGIKRKAGEDFDVVRDAKKTYISGS